MHVGVVRNLLFASIRQVRKVCACFSSGTYHAALTAQR